MKNNAVIDILLNWNKLKPGQKMQRLQDVENMQARFQGRVPRKVTNKIDQNEMREQEELLGRHPVAFYDRQRKDKIYIVKLSDLAIDSLKDVIHEGWHAYVDDYIAGKVSLRTYSKINKESFLLEEEHMEGIYRGLWILNNSALCDAFFAEERINYKETAMYIVKYIVDAIDNTADIFKLENAFFNAYAFPAENERRGKINERQHSKTYEEYVVEIFNDPELSELKTDISKAGKIIDSVDEKLLEFFNKSFVEFQEYYEIQRNGMLMPSVKEQMADEKILSIRKMFIEFIAGKLKNKKKN